MAQQRPPVHVRGLDPDVWKEMRLEAVRRGIPVARLLELVWREWRSTPPQPA